MSTFAGTITPLWTRGDHSVVRTRCAAQSHLELHQHHRPFLSILFGGSYREGHSKNWNECRGNAITWHPAGDAHEIQHGCKTTTSLQIEFSDEHFDGYDLNRALPRNRFTIESPRALALAGELAREADHNDEYSEINTRGLIMCLLSVMGRKASVAQRISSNELLKTITALMDESFPNSPDVTGLAESLGCTANHIAARYQQLTGTSIAADLRNRRVSHARKLLLKTDLPLSDISLASGFYDQSHFTHCFRRSTRVTPGQFRLAFK